MILMSYVFVQGYLYAGCQLEVMCFCGNTFGAYGPSDKCTMTCPDDKTEQCGGRLANTVMFTGLGTLCIGCSCINVIMFKIHVQANVN